MTGQGSVAPGTALRGGLIPRYYRYTLVGISCVLVFVAILAGGAFRQATIKSCEASNDAKAAVTKIIDTLYAGSKEPSPNPDIQRAREQNRAKYALLQEHFHEILSQEECGSLLP